MLLELCAESTSIHKQDILVRTRLSFSHCISQDGLDISCVDAVQWRDTHVQDTPKGFNLSAAQDDDSKAAYCQHQRRHRRRAPHRARLMSD